jgi:hypothetical protein
MRRASHPFRRGAQVADAAHQLQRLHVTVAGGRRGADLWNIPGGDIDDAVRRSARLDELCAEIGRDPASITCSIHLPVSYGEAGRTRDAIAEPSTPASVTSSWG